MRVLSVSGQRDLKELMREIKADPYGIRIMLPKAQERLVKINSLSSAAANILKQEMLSLGGDVAVARSALTGKAKKTGCLIMGNLAQLTRLSAKLARQPFGLGLLARDLSLTLKNHRKDGFRLKAGKYNLDLAGRARIMGILNVTPDSFSGDGFYRAGNKDDLLRYAREMVKNGADIIDVGGESTRPGAKTVSLKEEIARVIPAIKILAKRINLPVSVDTRKTEVARIALDNGASIVNDITGLRDARMAKIISRYKAAVVIMHMSGSPRTMQDNPRYDSLIDDIAGYLQAAVAKAQEAGVDSGAIVIDPGIGFGKTLAHNLEILKRLGEFRSLGKPILVGVSRKSFLGKILNAEPAQRLFGSIAASVYARINGAQIIRAHDILAVKQALTVADSIKR